MTIEAEKTTVRSAKTELQRPVMVTDLFPKASSDFRPAFANNLKRATHEGVGHWFPNEQEMLDFKASVQSKLNQDNPQVMVTFETSRPSPKPKKSFNVDVPEERVDSYSSYWRL